MKWKQCSYCCLAETYGQVLWGPYNRDDSLSILGSMLGPPMYGDYDTHLVSHQPVYPYMQLEKSLARNLHIKTYAEDATTPHPTGFILVWG